MKILLNGAGGRMGMEVASAVAKGAKHKIVASVDKFADNYIHDLKDFTGEADVIIDFSNHLGTAELLEYAVERNIPTVICTTGQTNEENRQIEEASRKIALFRSANMSVGVALLAELAVKTAAIMGDADIEIVETHHNRKLDAPSGTALMLANEIQKVRKDANLVSGRTGQGKRGANDIGIHSVRRGNIVGIHEVIVSTDNQTITLKHEAHSRALFADGALTAAEYICGKPAGMYDMQSIIGKKSNDF